MSDKALQACRKLLILYYNGILILGELAKKNSRSMAKFDIKDHNYRKGEAPSSLDQALLDEFLSIIASIAVRLTKDDTRANNCDDSNKQEASEK